MRQSQTVPFPKGSQQASRNGRGGRPLSNDADARYEAALKLVQAIDHNLKNGTQHYYDTQGKLLRTLDEVIHAVLTDTLASGRPTPEDAESVQWVPVGELVA
jgi:hypothetical protein